MKGGLADQPNIRQMPRTKKSGEDRKSRRHGGGHHESKSSEKQNGVKPISFLVPDSVPSGPKTSTSPSPSLRKRAESPYAKPDEVRNRNHLTAPSPSRGRESSLERRDSNSSLSSNVSSAYSPRSSATDFNTAANQLGTTPADSTRGD
jgi:hypothetical protein